ncbi:MAG: hypothetical protein HY313_08225 [Acidobacteria bacterium]|nr:hypothetical protein [Acidobacteriota bacterium]
MDLPAIAKLAGLKPSEVRVIHQRPALIQELNWRSQFSLSSSRQADPIANVRFSFYKGELFRILVNYNRYKTEGLTAEDMVEAISATYGTVSKAAAETTFSLSGVYNDTQVVIARWEDSQYSFSLFRSSYQPTFGMIALSKQLDAQAQVAAAEAIALDKQEAPQREIERKKKQDDENQVSQEKARLVNKPGFRP